MRDFGRSVVVSPRTINNNQPQHAWASVALGLLPYRWLWAGSTEKSDPSWSKSSRMVRGQSSLQLFSWGSSSFDRDYVEGGGRGGGGPEED